MTRVSLVRALGLRGYQWAPQPNDHPEYPFATAVRVGDVVYTSGQIPIEGDTLLIGLVSMRNLKEAQRAAELCAVQCLYAAGSLVAPEDILSVIKLTVFVNNDPLFDRMPLVANGASTFLNELFGTRHARTAVGARLPSGALVEIEAIIRVR